MGERRGKEREKGKGNLLQGVWGIDAPGGLRTSTCQNNIVYAYERNCQGTCRSNFNNFAKTLNFTKMTQKIWRKLAYEMHSCVQLLGALPPRPLDQGSAPRPAGELKRFPRPQTCSKVLRGIDAPGGLRTSTCQSSIVYAYERNHCQGTCRPNFNNLQKL